MGDYNPSGKEISGYELRSEEAYILHDIKSNISSIQFTESAVEFDHGCDIQKTKGLVLPENCPGTYREVLETEFQQITNVI